MKQFIIQETEKMRMGYSIAPERIISDYRKERREMDGYKGRQILELIQNADDASETSDKKHVLIELTDTFFSVSNNGEPFTQDGIKSLMYSDLSPKAIMQNKIGNKGTGFRSVLSWSKEIFIKSASLSVKFSEDYAKLFLFELRETNPQVKKYLEEQKDTINSTATLVVPQWVEEPSICTNYDTTIKLDLLTGVYQDIVKQLNEIDCETLLFLQNIEKLTMKYAEKEIIFHKQLVKNNVIEITQRTNGEITCHRKWNIREKTGNYNGRNYQITIAFTKELDDNKNILYSYFKTDVAFPFPAIIHGTFNLDANRNHLLKDNKENIHMLHELSELLIATSIEITKDKQLGYDALSLLCTSGEFATEINEMGFEEKLLEKIKKAKLFPTISKKYLSFTEKPKFYDQRFSEVLPKSNFPELMIFTDKKEIKGLMSRLSKGKSLKYDYEEFVDRVNKMTNKLKMKQRVKIIEFSLSAYSFEIKRKLGKTPNLLLDRDGKVIKSKETVFINPSKSETLENPPAFSNIKFLNTEMYRQLRREMDISTPRELANKLSEFGLREYAFDTVATRMISRLRKRVKNNSKSVKLDIMKTVKWFYSVYENMEDKIKQNPQQIFYLLNRAGEIVLAKELFIGKEYGNNVTENLLNEIVPNHFVANAQTFGLEINNQLEMIEFFTWLGVNKYPQKLIKEVPQSDKREYLDYVKSRWTYPLIIGDCNYSSLQEFHSDYRSCTIKVAQIDLLESILASVPTPYILDWFMEDETMIGRFEKGHELTTQSEIGFKLGYKENYRYLRGNDIMSYIAWKVMGSRWVDVNNGRVSPKKCCLARNSGIDFSPLVEFPNITEYVSTITDRKTKQKKREQYEDILIKTGIASDFGGMDEQIVYSILSALPEMDPDGKKAKSFYRQIIQNAEIEDWKTDSDLYEDFIQNGKVFAFFQNEKKYIPIQDVYYLNDNTVCQAIANSFPLLDLDKRIGKEKVGLILGVKPFKKIDFTLMEEPMPHVLNDHFKREFKKLLPYAYCYRYAKDFKSTELKKWNSMDIYLSRKVTVLYNGSNIVIDDYEYVEYGKNKVYMQIPSSIHSYSELLKVFEFRDAIADILSSSIDVEGNRKDYRELMAKTEHDRKKTILSDFDNPDLLNEVKRLFQQDVNDKQQFWMDVIKTCGKTLDEEKNYLDDDIKKLLDLSDEVFEKCNQSILFEDLKVLENAPYLIELFQKLHIDIEHFNTYCLENISLTKYLEAQLDKCKEAFKNNYATYLYDQLNGADIQQKQKFNQRLTDFENSKLKLENSVHENVRDILFKSTTDLTAIVPKDLNNIYFSNKQKLKELLKINETNLNDFLSNHHYDSLVYFGELIELQKLYVNFVKKEIEKEKQYNKEGLQEILDKLKSNPQTLIDVTDTEKPEQVEPNKLTINKAGSGFTRNKNSEKIGLKGERYVYAILKSLYSNVEWVSENAKLDQVYAEGKAGLGYDMKYVNDVGKIIYVEVKASTGDEESFYMSSNEMEFAEKQRNNFEIIFVTNINDDRLRKLYRYKNLFQYEEGQSRFENKKFRIDAKEYRLQTRKK